MAVMTCCRTFSTGCAASIRTNRYGFSAARAGLREGDVILAIANTEVANLKEFDAAITKADKNKPLNVLFRRGEWAQYALIRPAR